MGRTGKGDCMKIYVAGPLRNSDYRKVWDNVQRAIGIGLQLMKKGHVVFIPHLSYYATLHPESNIDGKNEHKIWMKQDLEWVISCDALFFLGHSRGADEELSLAKKMGLKIYTTLDEVPNLNF